MKESRKTQYTRKALADGMVELMKNKPFDKITVKELCDYADVNRSTFYMHYEDIFALLRTIEEDTLAWMQEGVGLLSGKWQEGQEATIRSLEYFFGCLKENSKYLQVLMSEQGNITFQKRIFLSAVQMCVFSPLESKLVAPYEDDMRLIFIVNGSVGIVRHWLKNGLKETPRQMAELIYDMTLPIR